jgi:hypothetical protein
MPSRLYMRKKKCIHNVYTEASYVDMRDEVADGKLLDLRDRRCG